ncbi:rCG24155 [Rattus norvegicus]|uniref:RCG24155 n=1 Tax=Rattus norvegicus TaxID=10116 RepID=A6KAD1_RAT|nr:rCG24155 [Rattus norvegicus]
MEDRRHKEGEQVCVLIKLSNFNEQKQQLIKTSRYGLIRTDAGDRSCESDKKGHLASMSQRVSVGLTFLKHS